MTTEIKNKIIQALRSWDIKTVKYYAFNYRGMKINFYDDGPTYDIDIIIDIMEYKFFGNPADKFKQLISEADNEDIKITLHGDIY